MSINYLAQHYLSKFPRLFNITVKCRNIRLERAVGIDKKVVENDTDLVVEGFPRCANTFFTMAIYHSTGQKLKLANHYHSEAQIVNGVRRGIPVIVLFRDPASSISSLLIRDPSISVDQAIIRYQSFYKKCLELRSGIVFVDFDDISADPYKCIRNALNKIGMTIELDPTNFEEIIFGKIEERNARLNGGRINEKTIARPSRERKKCAEEIVTLIKSMSSFYFAHSIYEELVRESQKS